MEGAKLLELSFFVVMLSLFGLQSYYCFLKVLEPVIIKHTVQKLSSVNEFPALTLCRKGLKTEKSVNLTDYEYNEFDVMVIEICGYDLDCINELLYTREDLIGKSYLNVNYSMLPANFEVSYNAYTVFAAPAVNCIQINHHTMVKTG